MDDIGAKSQDDIFAARQGAAHPRRFGVDEIDHAVALLSASFADDPVMRWIFRDDARTHEAFATYFRMALGEQALPHDRAFVSTGFEATAIWLPPSGVKDLNPGLARQIAMAPRIFRICGIRRLGRALALTSAMEKNHPKSAPHWYLFFLGVHPAMQGKGLGGSILDATLQLVDETGMPASLDNSNPKNTRLYQRHGFRVLKEYRARADAPPVLSMWRDARPIAPKA